MSQIALPLASASGAEPGRIVVGNANQAALDAFAATGNWPYGTAILYGPARSGTTMLARWFVESGRGDAIDDADSVDETELFHRWNRAQEQGRPLLLIQKKPGWIPKLPDLGSRLGAALRLTIEAPDDEMLAELIAAHAEQHGLVLGVDATSYLVPRVDRSHLGVEELVKAIDRISLERKQPPTLAIWREALAQQATVTGQSLS